MNSLPTALRFVAVNTLNEFWKPIRHVYKKNYKSIFIQHNGRPRFTLKCQGSFLYKKKWSGFILILTSNLIIHLPSVSAFYL